MASASEAACFAGKYSMRTISLYTLQCCITVPATEGALLKALKVAVADEAFKLPTDPARKALHVATCVMQSCETNADKKDNLSHQSKEMVASLGDCIPALATGGLNKTQRQLMWAKYHALICSSKFKADWTIILGHRCAILFQFLSRQMLDQLLLHRYPLPQSSSPGFPLELTSEEEKALRYAAGYIAVSIKKQLITSKQSHPMHTALLYGLDNMCIEDSVEDSSEDWLNFIDRGGLVHVNHTAFKFFLAMENELRQHLTTSKIEDMNDGCRVKLKVAIVEDIDVQHYFQRVTEDLEEEEQKSLLSLVVDLYITVRGFSFTRSWMEMYKQQEKKRLQKSKSLRKKLSSTTQ